MGVAGQNIDRCINNKKAATDVGIAVCCHSFLISCLGHSDIWYALKIAGEQLNSVGETKLYIGNVGHDKLNLERMQSRDMGQ